MQSRKAERLRDNFQQLLRFVTLKYGAVQSWKAVHLQTLEIRVERKGNQVKKREKNGGKNKGYWLPECYDLKLRFENCLAKSSLIKKKYFWSGPGSIWSSLAC